MLTDVTAACAVLGVMGPRSRELLAAPHAGPTCRARRSRSAPRARSGSASAPVRASRVTYVGELGWELYVPASSPRGVYDALVERRAGTSACATRAITRWTRSASRRRYRPWGHDIAGGHAAPGRPRLRGRARQAGPLHRPRGAAAPARTRSERRLVASRSRTRRRCSITTSRSGATARWWAHHLRRLRPHARPRGGARLRRPPRRRHRGLHRERPVGAGDRRRAPARAGAAHASLRSEGGPASAADASSGEGRSGARLHAGRPTPPGS